LSQGDNLLDKDFCANVLINLPQIKKHQYSILLALWLFSKKCGFQGSKPQEEIGENSGSSPVKVDVRAPYV